MKTLNPSSFLRESKESDKVTVKPTENKGNGLFALVPLKKGEVILTSSAVPILKNDWDKIKNTSVVDLYRLKWGNGHSIFLGPFKYNFVNPSEKQAWLSTEVCKNNCPDELLISGFNFINDSETPNVTEEFINTSVVIRALKDIQPGEEITKDYHGNPKNVGSTPWRK